MLGISTRGPLLRMGRSSLGSCVRAMDSDESRLLENSCAFYDRFACRAPWPDQVPNQFYLVLFVLPVASLYTALRERGWRESEAIDAVHDAFLATGEHERAAFTLLFRAGLGRRLFLRSLRPNWLGLTPPPANEWTLAERTPDRVTIEVSRCYRWDAFRFLGVPEVAGVGCDYEEYVFSGSPHLRVEWTGMPAGADRCRACLNNVSADVSRDLPAGE